MNDLSLREQFIRDMQLKNLAQSTQEAYLGHVMRFTQHYWKSPTELSSEKIKEYLHIQVEGGKSKSFINQVYSALKFLYETTMKQDWASFKIPRSKKVKRLPVPFEQNDLQLFFDVLPDLKYRAIFDLMYCGGLRISEVLKLKISNIHRKDMAIQVIQSKGNQDRNTLLSKTALETLELYYRIYRPTDYLFPGFGSNATLSPRTVQHVFYNALHSANIKKHLTVHSVRHTFATDMLESGVDIYVLQKLMGHSNISTTSIYLHVSTAKLNKVQSPHDVFYTNTDTLKTLYEKGKNTQRGFKSW